MNTAFLQNLEKKKTNKGWGIFSRADLPKNTVIFEFQGEVIGKDKVPNPLKPEDDHYLQIGKKTFIAPSGGYDDLINHSCAPNCSIVIVGNRAFVKSIVFISKGDEITFDYSTTSNDTLEEWKLECKCGDFNCRKNISGYNYLDNKTKERYIALGIIPSYITESK